MVEEETGTLATQCLQQGNGVVAASASAACSSDVRSVFVVHEACSGGDVVAAGAPCSLHIATHPLLPAFRAPTQHQSLILMQGLSHVALTLMQGLFHVALILMQGLSHVATLVLRQGSESRDGASCCGVSTPPREASLAVK